jgi:hypothetical protein
MTAHSLSPCRRSNNSKLEKDGANKLHPKGRSYGKTPRGLIGTEIPMCRVINEHGVQDTGSPEAPRNLCGNVREKGHGVHVAKEKKDEANGWIEVSTADMPKTVN